MNSLLDAQDVLARPSWAPNNTLFWFAHSFRGSDFLFTFHLSHTPPTRLDWSLLYSGAPSRTLTPFYPSVRDPHVRTCYGCAAVRCLS